MNLKDYSKTTLQKEKVSNRDKPKQNIDLSKVNNDYQDLIQEFLKRYGKMSEKQMLSEMFFLIQKKKREGNFNPEQIKNAAMAMAPFLSEEQRAYMFELLKHL